MKRFFAFLTLVTLFVVFITTPLTTAGSYVVPTKDSASSDFDETTYDPSNLNQNLELASQIPGSVYSLVVDGSYLYVRAVEKIIVMDISDPIHPRFISAFGTLDRQVHNESYGMTISSSLLFVADGPSGLKIFDKSNPYQVSHVSTFSTTGVVQDVAVNGNYAYVTDVQNGLYTLDISQPSNPVQVNLYNNILPNYVVLQNQSIYVARASTIGDQHIRILDATNPATPVEIGVVDNTFQIFDIEIAGNYLYSIQASWAWGYCLRITDVSNLSIPVNMGMLCNYPGWMRDVEVVGNYAYIADRGMRIIDISDAANPYEVSYLNIPEGTDQLRINWGFAFLANGSLGVGVMNISDAVNPTLISQTSGAGYSVAVFPDHFAYTLNTTNLNITNIAEPTSPEGTGSYLPSNNLTYIDLSVADDYAYLAHANGAQNGLEVVDITNNNAPAYVSSYSTPDLVYALAISANFAYLGTATSLEILNITNPLRVQLTGVYTTTGSVPAVQVRGIYAYLLDATASVGFIRILDVSNPSLPTEMGSFGYGVNLEFGDLVLSGNYLYVGRADNIDVFDISNPANPTWLSSYSMGGVSELTIQDNYLYVANSSGVFVFDISNPSALLQVGSYLTGTNAVFDVAVFDGYVYAVTESMGLLILELTVRIRDLASSPTITPNAISLSWTAPAAPNGGTVTGYDLRYSNSRVTDSNWGDAIQVTGEPVPVSPGTTQSMNIPNLTVGTRWYFAIKFMDSSGSLSAISNVPFLQDIGFRPNPDGYSFRNPTSIYPISPTPFDPHFRKEDLITMFGEESACWKVIDQVCILRPMAVVWQQIVNLELNAGMCDGMTVTSLRFFKNVDDPGVFQQDANETYDLNYANVRHHLAYFSVVQHTNPVSSFKKQIVQNSPTAIVNTLLQGISNGVLDPTTLIVRQITQEGLKGHTITPYAVESEGFGRYRIWVYDNNHPGSMGQNVFVDTVQNEWTYSSTILGTWYGDAATHTLGFVPISLYAQQPECLWCETSNHNTVGSASTGEVHFGGEGHLLIKNSVGQQLGYNGTQLVNEIPGANAYEIDGGLGIPLEPIYSFPLTDTYEILIDGQTITQTTSASVTQFGPGYATFVNEVTLNPANQALLSIAADGMQTSFQTDQASEIELGFAWDTSAVGYQISVQELDISAGQPVTLTVDSTGDQLIYHHESAGNGEYNLSMTRLTVTGEKRFWGTEISVLANDTHYIQFSSWDGQGSVTILVDHGSNGTIDETIIVGNEMFSPVHLPLIMR